MQKAKEERFSYLLDRYAQLDAFFGECYLSSKSVVKGCILVLPLENGKKAIELDCEHWKSVLNICAEQVESKMLAIGNEMQKISKEENNAA